jgi:sugar lactone lactonase YvrE
VLRLLPCLIFAVSIHAQSTYTTPYFFTTIAGLSSIGSNDGNGKNARFFQPQGIAVDSAGNLYVADSDNETIRKISRNGDVSTLAGRAGHPGNADGPGSVARFDFPSSLVVDATGIVYVADANNHAIRRISPDGTVTTFAGLAGTKGSDDGTGSAARFNRPEGLAIDAGGTLYVADAGNELIRKISPAGTVTTVAGSAGVVGAIDGAANAATFSAPFRIAVDAAGTLYVAEVGNYDIRKITPAGAVTTVYSGYTSFEGEEVPINSPAGLVVSPRGTILFADRLTRAVYELDSSGAAIIRAGGDHSNAFGGRDGTGSTAQFNNPTGLTADATGNLYVADTSNNTIRKITPTWTVTTIAGVANVPGSADGTGSAAQFFWPTGTAVDSAGNVYVADYLNETIRKISSTGVVTTLAGFTGYDNGTGDLIGATGSTDGAGSVARFYSPIGVAVDGSANVYVVDSTNDTIRKITPAGLVTTLAGAPRQDGSVDGVGSAARFRLPSGVAVDQAGNVYVTDQGNATVRKITAAGLVTTLAGAAGQVGSADGTGTAARFLGPAGITADGLGNVFVTDGYAIRKITSTGTVTTIAGDPASSGSVDGVGTAARFNSPSGVAVDRPGNIYVADGLTMRKITSDGIVSTLAGLAGRYGSTDDLGSAARFYRASGVAMDTAGNLYVADADNNTIRKGVLAGPPVITIQPQSQTVASGAAVQFSVTAAALPEPTYQWYFNGSAFNGATGSSLSFTGARSSDAGDYTVIVTNEVGAVTSSKATLTVSSAPPSTGGGSSGGGGVIGGWFVLALLGAAGVRGLARRAV